MKILTRCLSISLIVFFLLLISQNAHAAQAITLDTVQIDLWPEYDRPDVLVIYRARLSTDIPLPARLTLHIPRSAGGPSSVAMKDPTGMLYTLDYDTVVEGDWLMISFTTPVQDIQVEYYDPEMQQNDEQRSFTYRWPGDYQVYTMTLQVQKPLTATDITVTPSMGTPRLGADGLFYYSLVVGKLFARQTMEIRVSYNKSDDELSYSGGAVQPSEPIMEASRGRIVLDEVLPWLLGAAGLLLAAGGVIWYRQSGREVVNRRKRLSPARKPLQKNNNTTMPVYCHQCGKRAHSGDLFCRSCGSKLRNP